MQSRDLSSSSFAHAALMGTQAIGNMVARESRAIKVATAPREENRRDSYRKQKWFDLFPHQATASPTLVAKGDTLRARWALDLLERTSASVANLRTFDMNTKEHGPCRRSP